MNQYQDVTEIVDVTTDADAILVLDSAVITAAYGLFYFSSSAEDAAVTLSAVTDVAAMTAVSGLSYFSSAVADAAMETAASAITMADVDATTAAKLNICGETSTHRARLCGWMLLF